MARRAGPVDGEIGLNDLARPVLVHDRQESPAQRRRRELMEAMNLPVDPETPF